VPLGGTSNHFRVPALRAAGGWDPYNVTEDCDLGLRLAVAGKRVAILDSTTWEEANSRLGNWIRQRSRWIKGYMQTFLVWGRRPGRLLYRLGPWRTLWFLVTVGSVAIFSVLNPLLWLVLGTYAVALLHDLSLGYGLWELLATRPEIADRWSWPMVYTGEAESLLWMSLSVIFFCCSLVLLAFNVVFAWLHVHCGRHPDQRFDVGKTLLALPGYWMLMSIAGWKAAWQLIIKPHYWEKTVHGLDAAAPPQQAEKGASPAPTAE
jgi:cellulose synthase/poly-beta-1,6-N-acetylglucosamine synthase-like glycosyltransferase